MRIVVHVINVTTITNVVDFIAVDVIVATAIGIIIVVVVIVVIVVVEVAIIARKFATQVIAQQRL